MKPFISAINNKASDLSMFYGPYWVRDAFWSINSQLMTDPIHIYNLRALWKVLKTTLSSQFICFCLKQNPHRYLFWRPAPHFFTVLDILYTHIHTHTHTQSSTVQCPNKGNDYLGRSILYIVNRFLPLCKYVKSTTVNEEVENGGV